MSNPLRQLLLDMKEALDVAGVPFWLNDGTLLGAVRDGDFIPWECDVDVGAWFGIPDNIRMDVALSLTEKGYEVLITPIYITATKGAVYGDIEFYEDRDGIAVLPQWLPVNTVGRYLGYIRSILMCPGYYRISKDESVFKHYLLSVCNFIAAEFPQQVTVWAIEKLYTAVGYKVWAIPTKYFTELDTLVFCGVGFNVPANPEVYLAFRYGKDWRTPKRDWGINNDGGTK